MTRQPDPPDEAALRALAERLGYDEDSGAGVFQDDELYLRHGDTGERLQADDVVALACSYTSLLATLADLRARLAAVTVERDAAQRQEKYNADVAAALADQANALTAERNLLAERERVAQHRAEGYAVASVMNAERVLAAEQALAAMTAERDAWMASSAGYGSDMVEWKVRAQAAEQENARLRAELAGKEVVK